MNDIGYRALLAGVGKLMLERANMLNEMTELARNKSGGPTIHWKWCIYGQSALIQNGLEEIRDAASAALEVMEEEGKNQEVAP